MLVRKEWTFPVDKSTVPSTVGKLDYRRHLKPPWEPGKSGNPKGLKPGSKNGLKARLRRLMDKETHGDILKMFAEKGIELEDKDNAEAIAHILNRSALKGNLQAIKLIADCTDDDSGLLNFGQGNKIQINIHPIASNGNND